MHRSRFVLAFLALVPALVLGAGTASQRAVAKVPDPADLNAGWWDFVAPSQPGIEQRLADILSSASAAMARLPQPQAAAAAPSLERLRISLSALPAMLTARPAAPQPAPAPAESYTTTEILALDRSARDLQLELDERLSALTVADRAVKQAQRQLDADYSAYLAGGMEPAERTLRGFDIMASRSEIALTEAEQSLRRAETDAISARIDELSRLRERGLSRIVPDPRRSADQIRKTIAEDERRLEDQREALLRIRAERSNLASRPDARKSEIELADLRITAAMIDEAVLGSRIALAGTELDWLRISADDLDTATVAAIDARLSDRLQQLKSTEMDIAEWVSVVQRVIASTLRTPGDRVPDVEARTRADLLDLAQDSITRILRLRSLLGDLRFGAKVTSDMLAEAAGWRGWARTRVINPAVNAISATQRWLHASLFRIGEAPVTAWGLLRVALILLIAIALSRLVSWLIARISIRRPAGPGAGLYALGRIAHYLLIAAAVFIGLSSIGLDFSQLALVAGALSVGIGFGLQSVVNNFVSGLIILFEQNLKVGDVIELDSGVRGVVKEINVRSTLVTTSDAVDIVVPNGELISGKVTNYTLREPYHRIHVPFGVAYGSDKELVRRVVVEAANKLAFTHRSPGRDTDVWLVHLGDSSLQMELVVWINPAAVTRPGAVMATYLWEIETTLARNGIAIPFPQRDVRLHLTADEIAALGYSRDASR